MSDTRKRRLPAIGKARGRPRLRLIESSESDGLKRQYDEIGNLRGYVYNLHKVLAHSPGMLDGYMAMSRQIRDFSSLPADVRELVILLVALIAGSDYEWEQHLPIAARSGATSDQLLALPRWRARRRLYDARQRAALGFAEELSLTRTVNGETYKRARQSFSDAQLLELALTVGWYELTARVLLAFRVPPERTQEA